MCMSFFFLALSLEHVKTRISCDVQNSILHVKKSKSLSIHWTSPLDYYNDIASIVLYSIITKVYYLHPWGEVDIPIKFKKLSTILWRHNNAYVWALDGDTWLVSVSSKSPVQTDSICSFGSVRAVWNGVDVRALERLDAHFG